MKKSSRGYDYADRAFFPHVPRRTFLAGMGMTAAGMLLRPMFASAADAAPTRLLIVHRPCGTFPDQFFPAGNATGFTLPYILEPFEPVKAEMTVLNGIHCPRDHDWPGDQHGAGIITMMSGKRPIEVPGTSSGGDANAKNQMAAQPSIEQTLLKDAKSGLGGTIVPSIQSTAYRPSSLGLPNFKVMSYDANGALFPESRPTTLFDNLFGSAVVGATPAEIERARLQNKSILDFVHKDLTRLRSQVPKSQLTKLDAHLDGVTKLEARLTASAGGAGAACKPPTLGSLLDPTGDLTVDEAQHKIVAQNQLAIILAAFQCDLTRVATFTFAHGNSTLRFGKIIAGFRDTGTGHHDLSHNTNATDLHAKVERFYAEQLVSMLQAMKATPDGAGTLLDNTLVVYFNECGFGWSHSVENIPLLMFGGKNLKLQTGRHIKFGQRHMNDVWVAVANALGVPMTTYGDTAFSKGAVTGLFG